MKYLAIVLAALVLISATAFVKTVSATDDENTTKEVKAMAFPFGAKMRLLQLEKSIGRNILVGQEIVDNIKEINQSYNTSRLESLIEELRALKHEVSEVDQQGNLTEAVKQFVDLKSDAREITKEFREIVGEDFDREEIVSFRQKIGHDIAGNLTEINHETRDAVRDYNAQLFEDMLHNLGMDNQELVDQVRNGSATGWLIRQELREMLQQMNETQRAEALMKMDRYFSRGYVKAISDIDKAKVNQEFRKVERLEQRLEKMQNKTEMVHQRLHRELERLGYNQSYRGYNGNGHDNGSED